MSDKKAEHEIYFPSAESSQTERDLGVQILNNYDDDIAPKTMEHGQSRPKVLKKNKGEGQEVS